jgi:hypothetical protein
VTVKPAREDVGFAAPRIAARICAAVAVGNAAAYKATAPDTCGVAMDVPLYEAYEFVGTDETIDTPGAPISTVVAP